MTAPAPVSPAALDKLAFLAGHWRSETADVVIEEMWLAPAGGVAQGSVRLVQAGKVGTIEFIVVAAERDRVVMRYNHFHPDYRTWENDGPIALTLTEASDDAVTFTSLEATPRHALEMGYRRADANQMSSWVIALRDDGSTRRFGFDFQRVP